MIVLNSVSNIKNNRLFSIAFFIISLLFTLRSYYFYSISLAPTPVIATLLLIGLIFFYKISLRREELKLLAILLLIFGASSFRTIFAETPYINSVIGLLINFCILTCILCLKDRINAAFKILNPLFVIHISFFIVQLVAYYIFGEKVDFLEPITGEAQRVSGFERIEDHGGVAVFRPSGLFSEPSSYCVFMMTLLWIANKSKMLNPKVEIMVLFTVFSSFSISGIIFAIAYYILNYYSKINGKKIIVLMVFSTLVIWLLHEQIISYFDYRILNLDDDNSTSERLLMFSIFMDLDLSYQLFGSGVGNDIIDIPLTTIPSLLSYLGLIGSAIFLLYLSVLFKYFHVSYTSIVFSLLVSFNFYKISNPYVWFVIALLLTVSYGGKLRKAENV